MPVPPKVFTYELEGLSYTVTVYEEGGEYFADINVTEGAMDVNAIYFGDDDYSGDSEMLNGPLNMNGATNEAGVQWDHAEEISRPGLGRDGTDKETYVTEGDTLTLELDIDSIDEIDVFGIRATSTTTPEGSIKAISEDPEDPVDDPFLDKVGFGYVIGDNGLIEDGLYITEEELPEGVDPTFENYLAAFEENSYGDYDRLESVIFYELDAEGVPQELFRIEAPEGGFEDAEDVMAAYDEALEDAEIDASDESLSLIAALSLEETEEDEEDEIDDEGVDDVEFI